MSDRMKYQVYLLCKKYMCVSVCVLTYMRTYVYMCEWGDTQLTQLVSDLM